MIIDKLVLCNFLFTYCFIKWFITNHIVIISKEVKILVFFHSKIFLFFIIIFSIYIIIYLISKIECKLYKISTFDIINDKNSDKIKLVFLSDFHNKKFKNDYKYLIEKIISINPDYIVLGGDFIDFSTFQSYIHNAKYKKTLDFFENLSKKCNELFNDKNYNLKGIYFGFGNHELRLKNVKDDEKLNEVYDLLIKTLNKLNIAILDDDTHDLTNGITISGLNLYEGYYRNIFDKKIKYEHIDREIIDKHFNSIDKDKFNIMAFHKPDFCEDFIDYGFDLVLSGHNHGGLIKFPIIGSILSPDLVLFPKYNVGIYEYKNKHVIVSAGIGEHFIKIRVNNRPEICVININGKDKL